MPQTQERPITARYVTIDGLADYAKISPPTLRRLIKAGTIPACRVGRRILIDLNEFDECVRSSRVAS